MTTGIEYVYLSVVQHSGYVSTRYLGSWRMPEPWITSLRCSEFGH